MAEPKAAAAPVKTQAQPRVDAPLRAEEPRAQPDVFRRLWNASFTSVRLDLQRPTLSGAEPAKRKAPRRRSLFSGRAAEEESPPRRALKIGAIDVSSATLGVMQMWELGPDVAVAPGKRARRACDVGFGAVYLADAGEVQPAARLRFRVPYWVPYAPDAVLRLLPAPEAVLKGSWPLPFTGLRVGARLSLPFGTEQFDAIATGTAIPWRPLFRCKLATSADRGPLQFSSRGVELAEQSLRLGRDTVLRVAATVTFPREFPLAEDEPPLQVKLEKLAVKTRLRYGNYDANGAAARL